MADRPKIFPPAPWQVTTYRDPDKERLWISVDSLMELRNLSGAHGSHPAYIALLDYLIQWAKRTDAYGEDVNR